jgi:DMSO/TMAO reductase YedYZ molybdopterin-dependent catalytic subunit
MNLEPKTDQSGKESQLPPGQALTDKFPILHYGSIPVFNPENWCFRIWGEVQEEKTWNWEEFNRLPHSTVKIDLHCVTGWSKVDTFWEGVSVRKLHELGIINIKPEATYVMQHAGHGYTVNLPLEVVLQENFLLATAYEGKPLSPDHGYPVRGIVGGVPGRSDLKTPYLWKGAKWLHGLEFMKVDRPGFWEQAGFSNSADVWKEERTE